MKFETPQLGTMMISPNVVSYIKGPVFNLYDFIVKWMTLELAINDVMEVFIGGRGDIDVFQETLFYIISSSFEILYDHDLDFDHHFNTKRL